MSNAWSIFIIVLTVGNILGMFWLLIATSRSNGIDEAETTGHKWDGIEELNNPLPRWWLGLFIITIIFSVAYLYFYPGLGSYAGSLGWTQTSEFNEAKSENRQKQAKFFAEFVDYDIPALAQNQKAMETGERLFANNCATCHGSDGQGAKGFPNLTDNDWLYGGKPEALLTTITNGRAGVMPNLQLDDVKITLLARYLKSLSGLEVTDHVKSEGPKMFAICAACHGADAKGNQLIGAPNLTDSVWLHGSSIADIESVLRYGKTGNMPSFKEALSSEEIKLLTAYVISFANK
jgi:cytochrome c oxidase cbb3-type subunit 3